MNGISRLKYCSPLVHGFRVCAEHGFALSEPGETDLTLDDVTEVDGEW